MADSSSMLILLMRDWESTFRAREHRYSDFVFTSNRFGMDVLLRGIDSDSDKYGNLHRCHSSCRGVPQGTTM